MGESRGDVVRIGILGAASIAEEAVVRPARREPRAEVVAIAARDPRRAADYARRHGVPRVHQSYEALLADPDVDAVYNPLPNGLHGVWTVRSLVAGKHVLCEKPFTANAEEAEEVADVARSGDRVVMEGFHWRYHPMAERMLEIVRSGELGEVRHVDASLCFPLPRWGDIRYRLDLAGGALMDAGCYTVHMARTAVGEEPEVVGARALMRSPGVDRALTGQLLFPGGATATVTCSMWSARLLSIHLKVVGERGRLTLFNPLRPKMLGSIRVVADGRRRLEVPTRTSSYDHQLHAFVAAVLDGEPFPTTVDDAVANMSVIDDLYRAAGLEPRVPTPA